MTISFFFWLSAIFGRVVWKHLAKPSLTMEIKMGSFSTSSSFRPEEQSPRLQAELAELGVFEKTHIECMCVWSDIFQILWRIGNCEEDMAETTWRMPCNRQWWGDLRTASQRIPAGTTAGNQERRGAVCFRASLQRTHCQHLDVILFPASTVALEKKHTLSY